MELDRALALFEQLYRDVNVYEVSHKERERLADGNKNLTYGEILPETFAPLLQKCEVPKDAVFCDLGAGAGKAVYLAAMTLPLKRAFGVELLAPLVDASNALLERYDAEVRPQLPAEQQHTKLEFFAQDLVDADLSEVDYLFCNANAFQPPLLELLAKKLEDLRPGIRAMVVGMPLITPALELQTFVELQMDWGVAPAVFYRRV